MAKRSRPRTATSQPRYNLDYRLSRSGVRRVVLSTLEQLIDLYCDSDPRLGPTSEKGKHWAALTAIRLAGHLRYHLIGWAEHHIAGAIFRHAHTQSPSGDFIGGCRVFGA